MLDINRKHIKLRAISLP